mmetsp:Transcript_58683/g.187142  ORF Transcript_58683/g.187142 Transcript_58683/m.187142 type:complete len:205 (-) Transcript_58683:95-709(-)
MPARCFNTAAVLPSGSCFGGSGEPSQAMSEALSALPPPQPLLLQKVSRKPPAALTHVPRVPRGACHGKEVRSVGGYRARGGQEVYRRRPRGEPDNREHHGQAHDEQGRRRGRARGRRPLHGLRRPHAQPLPAQWGLRAHLLPRVHPLSSGGGFQDLPGVRGRPARPAVVLRGGGGRRGAGRGGWPGSAPGPTLASPPAPRVRRC